MAFRLDKPPGFLFEAGQFLDMTLVDHAMISRHLVAGVASAVYYIAGPPKMVTDLHAMLTRHAVSEADIHAEEFSGC
jgi:ferredoxin-NADP reductase